MAFRRRAEVANAACVDCRKRRLCGFQDETSRDSKLRSVFTNKKLGEARGKSGSARRGLCPVVTEAASLNQRFTGETLVFLHTPQGSARPTPDSRPRSGEQVPSCPSLHRQFAAEPEATASLFRAKAIDSAREAGKAESKPFLLKNSLKNF